MVYQDGGNEEMRKLKQKKQPRAIKKTKPPTEQKAAAKQVTLIISDCHNNYQYAQRCIDAVPEATEVVFLGDYWDDWGDNPTDAMWMAKFLKSKLDLPNYHFLGGNHDLPYMFPTNGHVQCPGFTPEKLAAIRPFLPSFDKFKLLHKTQGFFLSHAGIVEKLFSHPIHGLREELLFKECEDALRFAKEGMYHYALAPGWARGGERFAIGGLTWADWSELTPIKGYNQIVAHTPNRFVREKIAEDSFNYCIDCNQTVYGLIIDGKFKAVSLNN